MNDFQRIVTTLEQRDEYCALATVVTTEGSTYRHAGARMLMFRDGTMIGAISGGCLENDVFERGLRVLESGLPEFVVYDGRETASREEFDAFEDSLTNFGMGCNGVTSILIEPLQGASDPLISSLQDALNHRRAISLATVYEVSESGILEGVHAILLENGDILDNIGDHPLANEIKVQLRTFSTEAKPIPQSIVFEYNNILATVLMENVPLPKEIIIFGAGYDALPILDYASMLGWDTTVLDVRPAFLSSERLHKARTIKRFHTETIQETVAELHITPQTAVIVMTHHLERDAEVVHAVLSHKPCYCGLLGPKERFQKIQKLWKERQYKVTKDLLVPLHTPIGIDIGSETAEEVALSIIAEIQAVFNKRAGGFLKKRKERIHTD